MNRSKEFSAAAPALNTVLMQEEVRAGDNTISVQVTSPGTTTTLAYECSNNGTNWLACAGVPVGYAGTPTPASTSTAAGMLVFMTQFRYFRVRVSVAGTGNVVGVAVFGEGWTK